MKKSQATEIIWQDAQSFTTQKIDHESFELHIVGLMDVGPSVLFDNWAQDTVFFFYVLAGTAELSLAGESPMTLLADSGTVVFPGRNMSVRLTGKHNRIAYLSLRGTGISDTVLRFGFCDRLPIRVTFPSNLFETVQKRFTAQGNDGSHPDVIRLVERLLETLALQIRNCSGNARLFDIVKEINTMPRNDFTVEALLPRIGLSRVALCKAFAQAGFPPPGEYIAQVRTILAKEAITENRISLEQVALSLGFSGQNAFTAFFRRRTGTTPAVFRQRPILPA